MQTKRQIQQLLNAAGLAPNKRFGQHFLIDLNLMHVLVDAAAIQPKDVVLEVGCGTGSLTEALAAVAGQVIAVEVDRGLYEIARQQLLPLGNIQLVNTDILAGKNALDTGVRKAVETAHGRLGGRFLLVANLPYEAGSTVILNLVEMEPTADIMVVTVQKEVAQRMCARAGSRDYGYLTAMLQATGDVEKLRVLRPDVFWPRPKVQSAMIRYERRREKASKIADFSVLSTVIGLFIGHRRKTLVSCARFATGRLAEITDWNKVFGECDVDPKRRPDRLTPADYVRIANACAALAGPGGA